MIDKELQNLVWSILPKEFKEEVKRHFFKKNTQSPFSIECDVLCKYFGHHNLTSDAEGEEMLTVSAITVREMYAANERIKIDAPDKELGRTSDHINHVLRCLFDSKCLPDNADEDNFASKEPKFKHKIGDKVRVNGVNNCILCGKVGVIKKLPDEIEPFNYKIGFENDKYTTYLSEEYLEPYTEPKFRKGDKFKYKKNPGEVYIVERITDDGKVFYWDKDADGVSKACIVNPDYIEPYTEPEASACTETCADDCSSPCPSQFRNLSQKTVICDKQFDNILKDSFRGHNRLHIAAMMMQGMLSNTTRFSSYEISDLVRISLNCADALLREAEKGGMR